jgi:hypothetical protein
VVIVTRLGRLRLFLVAVVGACGVVAAAAPPVSAQLIDRGHEHIVGTDPDDEVCGIPVITTFDIIENQQERLASSGFPLFMGTSRGKITWTNPVTDQTVTLMFAGASKDLTVTDNGDGTITVRSAVTGAPELIKFSDGTVASIDAGRVVFVSVLDYNGTPTNVDDDEFVSGYIESISGPHPDLESDFELFCATVVPGLT